MSHILCLHSSSVENKDFEIIREFLTSVQTFTKVNPTQSTIGMNLNASRFKISGSIRPTSEICEVHLNLIPSGIQTQRHGAIEGSDPSARLEIAGTETTLEVSIIQNLHLEGKVAFQVLDDQNQKWEADSKTLPRTDWGADVRSGNIVSNDFKRDGADTGVCDSFDVAIIDPGTPNAQRFPADGVKNGEKSCLIGVSEHFQAALGVV